MLTISAATGATAAMTGGFSAFFFAVDFSGASTGGEVDSGPDFFLLPPRRAMWALWRARGMRRNGAMLGRQKFGDMGPGVREDLRGDPGLQE